MLPNPKLELRWQRLFGDDTPTHNRQFLKVDANLLERNKRRIASLFETGNVKKRDRDYRPAAGTVLTREFQGVEHCVIVTQDGQHYFQDRMHPSL